VITFEIKGNIFFFIIEYTFGDVINLTICILHRCHSIVDKINYLTE